MSSDLVCFLFTSMPYIAILFVRLLQAEELQVARQLDANPSTVTLFQQSFVGISVATECLGLLYNWQYK